MAAAAANHVAYTAQINPPSASPQLTREQIWACLERKIRAGQDFVGGAILSTDVLSEETDSTGHPVTVREVVFRDGNRRVQERCVSFHPMKVEFHQTDGSKVQNIVSEGSEGELYMTYTFEWLHPGFDQQKLDEALVKEKNMAKMAVESTIKVMREMVQDGRITA